ncbi:uncharacterized protein PAC_11225 [Phialocephala subalpina]|uniref:Uncharacterized protein n=1 Tax=Phialocephala subalpina TaxID=576137 RepID=A0A1L7X8I1_9HELO|nr:uncharacterized protein PAC_11225 [Phialocephala subalpina]
MSDKEGKKKEGKKDKKDEKMLKSIPKKTSTQKPSSSDAAPSLLYLSKRDEITRRHKNATQKTVAFKSVDSYEPLAKHASEAGSHRKTAHTSVSGSSSTTKPATKSPSVSNSSTKKEPTAQVSSHDKSNYKSKAGSQDPSKYATVHGSKRPTNMKVVSGSMKSVVPSFAKSTLNTSKDKEMAKRQSKIESLSLKERAEQEKWAQAQLRSQPACPTGKAWKRTKGGYQCEAKGHVVMDEMLAEGKGAVCFFDVINNPGTDGPLLYFGPYYYDKNAGLDGLYKYGGVQPKPDCVPEAYTWVLRNGSEHHSAAVYNGGMVLTKVGYIPLAEFERNRKEMGLKYCF